MSKPIEEMAAGPALELLGETHGCLRTAGDEVAAEDMMAALDGWIAYVAQHFDVVEAVREGDGWIAHSIHYRPKRPDDPHDAWPEGQFR